MNGNWIIHGIKLWSVIIINLTDKLKSSTFYQRKNWMLNLNHHPMVSKHYYFIWLLMMGQQNAQAETAVLVLYDISSAVFLNYQCVSNILLLIVLNYSFFRKIVYIFMKFKVKSYFILFYCFTQSSLEL